MASGLGNRWEDVEQVLLSLTGAYDRAKKPIVSGKIPFETLAVICNITETIYVLTYAYLTDIRPDLIFR